ncbi:MAG: carboxypeptidase regulatory-like domain-containing protein [Candidatus Eisenbacteria bacterium]|nr:carboxypeptidase regulatory-like domain-containing protein [Candidatus Eisenbacteria bacterium]
MKVTRLFALGMMLVLFVSAAAYADIHPIPLDAERSHLTLADLSRDVMEFELGIAEFSAMDVETPEGTFSRLMIPGFHSSKVAGSPELPMMNRLFEIPLGASVRVEVVSVESRTISLADYGIENALMPAQPSMPKSADPEDWPFVYNEDAYRAGRVGQEMVRVERVGAIRGVEIARVEVSPVEYMPRSNEIVVAESIRFRLHFEGADHARGEAIKAATYSPFFEPVHGDIAGYQSPRVDYPDLVKNPVTLVVIVPSDMEATMQDFIDWKTERGFTVVTGVIGSPEVGSTTATIQAYIHDLYNNPPAGQAAPSFVVFVGDVAQCPTFTEAGDATDRPYCAVDGDLMPDIYYGRLSATSTSMLQDILDKTLMYDEFTMPDPSYLAEVTMIAGMDGTYASTWANGQINYGTTYYFNAAHGITSNTYLYPESGSHAADIVSDVSNGVAYINYTAHGSNTSWADPSFTQTNVRNLTNYGKYCLAVGNCCLTSTYDYAECFAETWLREADKGAIGYIGGSNSTYWDEDWYWGVGNGTVNANPTYEATGLGAYDGVFHDHGEEMDAWYVTNDALIFRGNLAVTESGSSRITYYWNIYNLMGDPSITTYMGVPATQTVGHPSTVFTTSPNITVTAVPGSYVGVTQDGALVAGGGVDETGTVTLTFDDVLTPGTIRLVVMAQNKEPYKVDVPVIVPATIIINPTEIDANVETDVVVEVYEADGVTPKPGVNVWAAGLDYETTPVATNAAGVCTVTVNYPYGPTLDIIGQETGEPYLLFTEQITVNASTLSTPDLWVTTTIGLADTFALNLAGTLNGTCKEGPSTIYAILPDGTELSTTTGTMKITPDEIGFVTAYVAVSGYDVYTETFPIIEAYGTLTGHVDADGSPADGAVVKGYDALDELVFEVTCNSLGDYDVGEEILVAPYTIEVDYFGYLHFEQSFFVNYGANVLDIDLDPAPSGVLFGTVTDDVSGDPLYASLKFYRSDNMELYTETVTDSTDGSFTSPALPYFDWVVTIKAWHHRALTTSITIEDPTVEKHFVLEPTNGDFLVIDDGAKGTVENPAKYDEKTGELIAQGYTSVASKAAADIVTDLETIGYSVTLETVASTNPATWNDYDAIIVSSGNNAAPVEDATFRSNVESFVLAGGHILVEGGEMAYDAASYPGYPTFAANVLHVTGWNHDSSGNLTVHDVGHYLVTVPNTITGPITVGYVDYGDQDAFTPAADATKVCAWSTYPENTSIVVYDPNPAPEGGQIVYYGFNYSSAAAADRILLLENTMTYLTALEMGDCSVSGTVTLEGQSNHSGVTVQAIPDGGSVVTGQNGSYELTGLYAGPYQIVASKDGWATGIEEITLTSGQHMTGVDLTLSREFSQTDCSTPALAIPDNNTAGVSDIINVPLDVEVTGIAVYLDITHTYIGDLIVTLESPGGAIVTLHNRSGGTAENIVGWYPDDLEPAGDLGDFLGLDAEGDWTLTVSDNAGYDTGTLNEWCLKITYEIDTGVEEGAGSLPKALALVGNVPNPFNPTTTIRFDLPKAGHVSLSVYDLAGRRVTTLVDRGMDAGSHDVIWTGLDSSGRSVASGIYFYRLEAENKTMTRKMVLLK